MKIEYTLIGDYYLPNLKVEEGVLIRKYGRMKLNFIKDNRKVLYINLLITDQLNSYLAQVDKEAYDLYDKLIVNFKEKRNITEELKEKDQMRWVQEMNNIQNCIEEIIRDNIINR